MAIAGMGFGRALRRLGAAAFFAAAIGAAAASTWVMHGGPSFSPVIVVTPGAPATINLCATNACAAGGLTTTGTAVIAVTGTSTTVNTAGAGGSQTQTVTTANAQAVSNLTFVPVFNGVAVSGPITLSSLGAAPVTVTFCVGGGCAAGFSYLAYDVYTFKASPSAALGSVTVDAAHDAFASTFSGAPLPPVTTTASLTLAVPGAPAGATVSDTHAGSLPTLLSAPPVKGPPPAPTVLASATPDLNADEAQAAIQKCGVEVPSCVADALDAYANHLEAIADKLPPSMRNLPRTIHEAARKVREAKTPAAAVKAIKAAIAQVKVSITLIRAVDSDAAAFGRTEGGQAVNVLNAAQVALTRVSGL